MDGGGGNAHETWACPSIGRQDPVKRRPLVAGRRHRRRDRCTGSRYSRSIRDREQSTHTVRFGIIARRRRLRATIFGLLFCFCYSISIRWYFSKHIRAPTKHVRFFFHVFNKHFTFIIHYIEYFMRLILPFIHRGNIMVAIRRKV